MIAKFTMTVTHSASIKDVLNLTSLHHVPVLNSGVQFHIKLNDSLFFTCNFNFPLQQFVRLLQKFSSIH